MRTWIAAAALGGLVACGSSSGSSSSSSSSGTASGSTNSSSSSSASSSSSSSSSVGSSTASSSSSSSTGSTGTCIQVGPGSATVQGVQCGAPPWSASLSYPRAFADGGPDRSEAFVVLDSAAQCIRGGSGNFATAQVQIILDTTTGGDVGPGTYNVYGPSNGSTGAASSSSSSTSGSGSSSSSAGSSTGSTGSTGSSGSTGTGVAGTGQVTLNMQCGDSSGGGQGAYGTVDVTSVDMDAGASSMQGTFSLQQQGSGGAVTGAFDAQ